VSFLFVRPACETAHFLTGRRHLCVEGTQVNFSLPPKCSPDNDEVCAEDSDDVKIRPLAPISPAAASSASSSHCGPDDLTTTISGDEQTCKGGDSCT
jgi:hypothetical protein